MAWPRTLGQKPRRCVGVNFHIELDVPERQEIFELRLADLQSHPCPRGRAMEWWSSLRGPIPVETQSRPGRSPFLATSPSVSAESTEQQLSTFILDFSAHLCPLFLYCNVFAWSWYQGNVGFIEHIGKCFPIFLTNLHQNWYFFLKCLVEFTREAIQVCIFLCGKVFNYNFNFFNRYQVI